MPKKPISIRIDSDLYERAVRKAESMGVTFSQLMRALLAAVAEGNLHIEVVQNHPIVIYTQKRTGRRDQ